MELTYWCVIFRQNYSCSSNGEIEVGPDTTVSNHVLLAGFRVHSVFVLISAFIVNRK